MKNKIILLVGLAFLATGIRASAQQSTVITVASEMADCIGVAPQKCLLIKWTSTGDWEYWYSGIEGFDYIPGYEYVLQVREEMNGHGIADMSSLKLVLEKVILREQKRSEGLPAGITSIEEEQASRPCGCMR